MPMWLLFVASGWMAARLKTLLTITLCRQRILGSSTALVRGTKNLGDLIANYLFGFPTIAAADAWFSPMEAARLRALGFRLMTVEAFDVVTSDTGKQCIFRRQE